MLTADEIIDYVAKVFFVLVVITIPIYALVVACIVYYRKHLTSSFFHLSAAVGVADIWVTTHRLVCWTCARLFYPDWAMKHETVFATYSKFGTWYIYFAAVFGVVVISVNRLMALMVPLKYKSVWTPKVTRLSILATWILPLPFAIPMLFPCCYSRLDPVSYRPRFLHKAANAIYWQADVIIEPGIIAPFFVVMYSLMFWKARQRSHGMTAKRNSKQVAKKMKVELKLAIMGVIISGLYVIMVTTYILWYLDYHWPILDHIVLFTGDLFAVSNPYLLLLFSTKLRSYFVRFVTCGKVVPKHPMLTSVARRSILQSTVRK